MHKHLKNSYFLWVLMVCFLFQACHIRRMRPSVNQTETQGLRPWQFHYLTIHSSIHIEDGINQHKLRVQFRIQQNKLIWFSVATPWGIELARGRMTPQAVEVINHVERTYTIYSYQNLEEQWSLPGGYDFIQAMLLGELPADFNYPTDNQTNEYTIIRQQRGAWNLKATIKNAIRKIERWEVFNEYTQDYFGAYYQQFKLYPTGLLFKHAQLRVGPLLINMTHTRVHSSNKKLNFPFRIPQRYVKL